MRQAFALAGLQCCFPSWQSWQGIISQTARPDKSRFHRHDAKKADLLGQAARDVRECHISCILQARISWFVGVLIWVESFLDAPRLIHVPSAVCKPHLLPQHFLLPHLLSLWAQMQIVKALACPPQHSLPSFPFNSGVAQSVKSM